jgi:ribosomal protein S18 acetylase RimI-like enzyme
MIRHAEAWLCALGVRKVQLLIRESNIGAASCYDRLGYERSPVIVMQRWLLPPHSSEN